MKLSKIKKIEKRLQRSCYDLTVERNHNFFCNNVLIHNCDYRGEVKVLLINHGTEPFVVNEGDRIAQLIFAKVQQASFIKEQVLNNTDRGAGGFGSTGIK